MHVPTHKRVCMFLPQHVPLTQASGYMDALMDVANGGSESSEGSSRPSKGSSLKGAAEKAEGMWGAALMYM